MAEQAADPEKEATEPEKEATEPSPDPILAGRGPKEWTPAVAMLWVLLTLIAAGVLGRGDHNGGALLGVLVGMFACLTLLGLWTAPATPKGTWTAIGLAFVGASLLTVSLVGFAKLADSLQPERSSPSTTTSSPTTTTVSGTTTTVGATTTTT